MRVRLKFQGTLGAALLQEAARALVRLAAPGGIVLFAGFLLVRLGVLDGTPTRHAHLYPAIIFGLALVLSAAFHRSRIFLASLLLGFAHAGVVWLPARVPPAANRVLFDAIALLLPLNLIGFTWLKDRGILSPAGARRMACIGLQAALVGILMHPRLAYVASFLDSPFLSRRISDWSGIPQPALLATILAIVALAILLARRYRVLENSFLWSLAATLMALHAGTESSPAAVYFGCTGVMFCVAVLETSYRMAYRDELTGLPGRRALNEALLKLGEYYTIAMVDVDHFKKFNDSYGHEAGDQALQLVASRLARVTGGGKAYRYGGEEFTVLFPGKQADDAYGHVDGLRQRIEQSRFIVRKEDRRKSKSGQKPRSPKAGEETSVTVSIGVAASQSTAFTVEQVLRSADRALYKAKAKGRNCTVISRPRKPGQAAETKARVLQVG